MQCISIKEPFASAILFGFKKSELRNFKINGKCLVHCSKSFDFKIKDLVSFYRSIGANITADVFEVAYKITDSNENCYYSKDENKTVINDININNDFIMANTLFNRNIKVIDFPFLFGMIIGEVNFNETINSIESSYKYENFINEYKVFDVKNSIFYRGKLGLFQV